MVGVGVSGPTEILTPREKKKMKILVVFDSNSVASWWTCSRYIYNMNYSIKLRRAFALFIRTPFFEIERMNISKKRNNRRNKTHIFINKKIEMRKELF